MTVSAAGRVSRLGYGHTFAAQDESDQALAAYRTASRFFSGPVLPTACDAHSCLSPSFSLLHRACLVRRGGKWRCCDSGGLLDFCRLPPATAVHRHGVRQDGEPSGVGPVFDPHTEHLRAGPARLQRDRRPPLPPGSEMPPHCSLCGSNVGLVNRPSRGAVCVVSLPRPRKDSRHGVLRPAQGNYEEAAEAFEKVMDLSQAHLVSHTVSV